ncbi:hypothetical protein EDB29_1011095 [Vibrio crassostreae]|uniref:hypothetical protein n=1 Tax=Vibrio crassostreae TaxID=246167 RepID=UPI0010532845|nr:hypothetical protein [Vibrio crassostreae]CAH6851551.1 hypothetical protein VCHA34P121_10501 [Vibrio chagasii]TCT44283.1 hypothetical protein EDB29_1011095 [Vibrio crassostreae]CAH6863164.1 hypothetical protein VCHA28FP16_10840 [Vibrio chagasii]CAH6929202.1 hypothetical protein VCHA48P437_100156 [Vibrio chagasii]CAH6948591.1 hypothetical protein VCHA44O286_110156 [Vibrio chagasii]
MPKYFLTPFASGGDKTEVPDYSEDASISYSTGYTFNYEINPDESPEGLFLERDKWNQVLFDITDNIKWWQENSFPDWIDNTIDDQFGYPKGAVTWYQGNLYTSVSDNNQSRPDGSGWSPNAITITSLDDLNLTDDDFSNISDLYQITDNLYSLHGSNARFMLNLVEDDYPNLRSISLYGNEGVIEATLPQISTPNDYHRGVIKNIRTEFDIFGLATKDSDYAILMHDIPGNQPGVYFWAANVNKRSEKKTFREQAVAQSNPVYAGGSFEVNSYGEMAERLDFIIGEAHISDEDHQAVQVSSGFTTVNEVASEGESKRITASGMSEDGLRMIVITLSLTSLPTNLILIDVTGSSIDIATGNINADYKVCVLDASVVIENLSDGEIWW